jgi:UDP-glucose 4-epimerase
MLAQRISRLVFSSTCAVYGIPAEVPIGEDTPHAPITPYGASKAAFERLLLDVGAAHDLRSIVFRYFNAAGAHEAGDIGELHEPETHLVPIVLEAIAGRRDKLVVHGIDYDTADGTCERDYIDVRDIARAHVVALESLAAGDARGGTFNLGHGRGHSVLDVVRECEAVTGRKAPVEHGPRRPGDPPRLIARVERVREALGWTARHELRSMVETAWRFMERRTRA